MSKAKRFRLRVRVSEETMTKIKAVAQWHKLFTPSRGRGAGFGKVVDAAFEVIPGTEVEFRKVVTAQIAHRVALKRPTSGLAPH